MRAREIGVGAHVQVIRLGCIQYGIYHIGANQTDRSWG